MKKAEYRDYLKSGLWEYRRLKMLDKYNRCCVCKEKTNLNIHHVRYTSIGNEKAGDLVVLCRKCHYKLHKGPISVRKRLRKLTRNISKRVRNRINNCKKTKIYKSEAYNYCNELDNQWNSMFGDK